MKYRRNIYIYELWFSMKNFSLLARILCFFVRLKLGYRFSDVTIRFNWILGGQCRLGSAAFSLEIIFDCCTRALSSFNVIGEAIVQGSFSSNAWFKVFIKCGRNIMTRWRSRFKRFGAVIGWGKPCSTLKRCIVGWTKYTKRTRKLWTAWRGFFI